MENKNCQFVDLEVTKQKYNEEFTKFQSLKEDYRRLGVLLLEDSYPNLFFAFTAPTLSPVPIIFSVKINFDNYDVQPLSVQFVHPLTFSPILGSQMHTRFPRKLEGHQKPQELLQFDKDEQPFFCIPGIREYHKHPFHTGDSWFLYRKKGKEGSLCFILDNLQLYGTTHINAYQIPVQFLAASNKVAFSSDPHNLSF